MAGIILAYYNSLNFFPPWSAFAATAIYLTISVLLPFRVRYNLRFLSGLFLQGIILLAAVKLTRHFDTSGHFAKMFEQQRSHAFVVHLEETPSEKLKTYKSIASVLKTINGDSVSKGSGKLIIYFNKDDFSRHLFVGDILMIFAQTEGVRSSGNPGSFDYASYCLLQGIRYQCFVASKNSILIQHGHGWKVQLDKIRRHICSILERHIRGAKECGLAEALLIGYKDNLDPELVQQYSNTGVVHVIAISGLHLGLLYMICKGVIRIIPFIKRKKWLSAIIIICFLWLFSLLTGGSPSVLRSAVMFTALIAGDRMAKKISMYNCLAASAFLLLCYNPYWLFDIGFQLSYSAVLSILIFMKPLYNTIFYENKLMDMLWQLVSVTLAAQILTTPVSLYHFHRFPNYFLFANLAAVPLSSIILVGEIVLCMTNFFSPAAQLLGMILEWLLKFMNDIIEHINELPYAIVSLIEMNIQQVILLYLMITAITVFLFEKMKKAIFLSFCCLVLFLFIRLKVMYDHSNQAFFIVYNLRGRNLVEIIEGRRSIVVCPTELQLNDYSVLEASHTLYQIKSTRIEKTPSVIHTQNLCFFLLQNRNLSLRSSGKAERKILIVSNNFKDADGTIIGILEPFVVITDATNSAATIKWWRRICFEKGIKIHTVVDKGAFVMKLN